jgi:hypothetical protein
MICALRVTGAIVASPSSELLGWAPTRAQSTTPTYNEPMTDLACINGTMSELPTSWSLQFSFVGETRCCRLVPSITSLSPHSRNMSLLYKESMTLQLLNIIVNTTYRVPQFSQPSTNFIKNFQFHKSYIYQHGQGQGSAYRLHLKGWSP